MTRYTQEDARQFMAEEEARSAEEAAAYFAWKRGDISLDSQPPQYTPPEPDTTTPNTTSENTHHLFDELAVDEEPRGEKVDIDSIDVDDFSDEGRERRMKAMADELEGFSAGQRMEAERREGERVQDGLKEGRKIMDQYGRRFEDTRGRRK
jgi:hypothetical protein